MPVNDLVPLLSKSGTIDYRKVVFKIEKKMFRNKFTKFKTHSDTQILINQIGIISFMLLLIRLRIFNRFAGKTTFHFHNASLCFFSILLMNSKNLASVVNLHNDWQNFSHLQKIALFVGFRNCVKLISVSSYIIKTIPAKIIQLTNLSEKLVPIPNFVNVEELYSDRNINRSRDYDVVIVGRLVPQKNWKTMIRVLAACKSVRSVKWFGAGLQSDNAKRQVNKLGLHDKIEFQGVRPRHEVLAYLKNSKVYMCLSLWEGIGVANLEAIGCGCFPVLSTIGPHDEIAKALNFRTFSLDNEAEISRQIDLAVSNSISFDVCQNVFDSKFGINTTQRLYENALCSI